MAGARTPAPLRPRRRSPPPRDRPACSAERPIPRPRPSSRDARPRRPSTRPSYSVPKSLIVPRSSPFPSLCLSLRALRALRCPPPLAFRRRPMGFGGQVGSRLNVTTPVLPGAASAPDTSLLCRRLSSGRVLLECHPSDAVGTYVCHTERRCGSLRGQKRATLEGPRPGENTLCAAGRSSP